MLVNVVIEVINNIDYEMLIRLLIAALLGLAMGLEREFKRKSLGLKTILVISIVSCLLTIVSIQSSYIFPATTNAEIRMDPLRLAAQIVSGVGFLGAGVILRREDDTVSGLTTAAIVWGAAGIGIATGAGFYVEAIIGVMLLLISVELIPLIIHKLGVKQLHLREQHLRVIVNDRKDIKKVTLEVEKCVIEVKNIRIKDLNNEEFLLVFLLMVRNEKTTIDIYSEISNIDKIESIELRA